MKGVGLGHALILVLAPLVASGCGAGGTGGGVSQAQLPACATNTFRLTGEIDSMSIDITEPATGGFSQDDSGGQLTVGNPIDPTSATQLTLTWSQGLANGQMGAASGTFVLATGALGGQSFCAGPGTIVNMPADQTLASIQFSLEGLASGNGCTTAHTGTLQGCMN